MIKKGHNPVNLSSKHGQIAVLIVLFCLFFSAPTKRQSDSEVDQCVECVLLAFCYSCVIYMIVFTLSQIICDILDQILTILLPRSSDAPGLLLQKAVPSDIKSDAELLTRWLRYDGVYET